MVEALPPPHRPRERSFDLSRDSMYPYIMEDRRLAGVDLPPLPIPGGLDRAVQLTTLAGLPVSQAFRLSTAVTIRRARAARAAHEMCGVM